MLNILRKSIAGPLAKIFIGLLVLSFAVWGIQDIFGNYGNRVIATIDKIELTVENYIKEYNKQLSLISRSMGRQLSQEEALSIGVDREVLQNLIVEGLLRVETENLRLGVSESYIANKLISDNTFFRDGKFNKDIYLQRISLAGYNEETFLEELIKTEKKLQLYNIISSGIKAPNIMVEAKNSYDNNERIVEYIVLPNKQFDIKYPLESELKEYYENFQNNFIENETRDFEILTLNQKSVKELIKVNDKEINDYYKENINDYFSNEKREVYQFLFDNLTEAELAYKNSYKKDISNLISELNYETDDIFIGNITKDKIADPVIANLAFSIEQNSYSQPTKGALGFAIIYINNITKEQTLPIEKVKIDIEEIILTNKSDDKIIELFDKIEDARAAGENLTSIASELSLNVNTYSAVNSSGLDNKGNPIDEIKDSKLIESIFSNEIDTEVDAIESEVANSFAWLHITEINAPYIKAFNLVKKDLAELIINEEKMKQEKLHIKSILDKIQATNNINTVANELGVDVNASQPFSRKNPSKIFSNDFIKIIFNSRINSTIAGKSPVNNQNIILTIKKDIKSIDKLDDNSKLTIETFEQQLNNDIFDNYINGLQNKYDITVNQDNLNQLFANSDE
jgi:peptidyl-prolyl cis-trans isomerase D|tara:strand:- start:20158 stop:22041 length:1884 start_codon:yes stop_codon:yes gene_type:complete